MAPDSPPTRTTDDLIAEISRNREVLAAHRAGLQRAAHVGDRLQRSYHEHAGLFFGTAAALGLLLSLVPASGKSRRDKRASRRAAAIAAPEPARRKESRSLMAVMAGLTGKLALDMGKPILLRMVRDHYAAVHRPAAARTHETGVPQV